MKLKRSLEISRGFLMVVRDHVHPQETALCFKYAFDLLGIDRKAFLVKSSGANGERGIMSKSKDAEFC